ncbi:MAG: hypothetical protein CMO40_09580 [Verrucomicrobiaceae bacterium]|nr:hypothetical protein [Verrucomicrobiaceae bacterium]
MAADPVPLAGLDRGGKHPGNSLVRATIEKDLVTLTRTDSRLPGTRQATSRTGDLKPRSPVRPRLPAGSFPNACLAKPALIFSGGEKVLVQGGKYALWS